MWNYNYGESMGTAPTRMGCMVTNATVQNRRQKVIWRCVVVNCEQSLLDMRLENPVLGSFPCLFWGDTPVLAGGRYPPARTGWVPPAPGHLLCRGQYASCVHAGGLSYFSTFSFHWWLGIKSFIGLVGSWVLCYFRGWFSRRVLNLFLWRHVVVSVTKCLYLTYASSTS